MFCLFHILIMFCEFCRELLSRGSEKLNIYVFMSPPFHIFYSSMTLINTALSSLRMLFINCKVSCQNGRREHFKKDYKVLCWDLLFNKSVVSVAHLIQTWGEWQVFGGCSKTRK